MLRVHFPAVYLLFFDRRETPLGEREERNERKIITLQYHCWEGDVSRWFCTCGAGPCPFLFFNSSGSMRGERGSTERFSARIACVRQALCRLLPPFTTGKPGKTRAKHTHFTIHGSFTCCRPPPPLLRRSFKYILKHRRSHALYAPPPPVPSSVLVRSFQSRSCYTTHGCFII